MATITTIDAADLISDSRTDINTNFSNLNSDKIETSYIDTDTALAANSDTKIPSQKAVKAYVDGVGTPNASTTVRGLVEISTQAQYDAGTATGETGALLAVTPALVKASTNPIVRTYLNAGSPATWTKPAGLKYVIVEVQSAGGGGGGGVNTEAAGGGGGGGYSRKLIAVATLGATETVTTGAGGTAGSAAGGTGGTGGTTSFGSLVSVTGGVGGTGGTGNGGTYTIRAGGAGGTGSDGDYNIPGQAGGDGVYGGAGATIHISGKGGDSQLGTGAVSVNSTDGAGIVGNVYGGGGSGATEDDATGQAGGVGGAGIVIVTEYYS